MSSWKQYGGINNYENRGRINTESLSVNRLIFKEAVSGNFDICGGLHISGDSLIDGSITVMGNSDLKSSVNIGTYGQPGYLNIYNTSVFYGTVNFINDFVTQGNTDSNKNVNVKNNIVLGNILYFDNGDSQYMYGSSSGLGINTLTPNAGLDISTNLTAGLNIYSNQTTNNNILAQNNQNYGVILGVDNNASYIDFYNDNTVLSGNKDATIRYLKGGTLFMDTSTNILLNSSVSVSDRNQNAHVNGETMVIYDTHDSVYFGNVYGNPYAKSGSALSLISQDYYSNAYLNITNPQSMGIRIGGGTLPSQTYPTDNHISMGYIGLIDVSGTFTPSQTIVTSQNKLKYPISTGINNMDPLSNTYVLDINGPIHVDNGDITDVTGPLDFELYSMSVSKLNPSFLLALGSSYDISGGFDISGGYIYREKILRSYDYGGTWETINIPNVDIKGAAFTNIYTYNENNSFISGYNNTLMYSNDWGFTWRNLSAPIGSITQGVNYSNININRTPKINGNIVGYFSIDLSSTLVSFEFNPTSTSYIPTLCNNTIVLDSIKSIDSGTNSLYLAGNVIAKYNISNYANPVSNSPLSIHSHYSYKYHDIAVYDNSFVVAAGMNILSSTTNGGLTWTDKTNFPYDISFNSVYIYDLYNAIAVGSYGNIWITYDSGTTWSSIPISLINSSGKSKLLTNSQNYYRNVVMSDPNTILLTNTLQHYSLSQYGSSNIFNVFSPNFVNSNNNVVMDICGTIHLSRGDLSIVDGSIISSSPNFHLLDNTVSNLYIGGETSSLLLGNSIGGNVVVQHGLNVNATAQINKLNVLSDVSFQGNVVMQGKSVFQSLATFNSNINTGNVYANYVLPKQTGGNIVLGGGDNDIYLGYNNAYKEQTIYIGQGTNPSATNISTIYIGSQFDKVFLRGNTTIEQKTTQVVGSPTIIVNKTDVPPIQANSTSYGAGIDIFDNSGTILGSNPNGIYSYIHVGRDLQSFVLKAPSYGAFNGSIAAPNSGYPLQLLSPQNRLRIGVNELTLSDKPSIKRGLVILQSNSDYNSYQSSRGHAYTSNDDADYAINICDTFDISNIMLKNSDTVANTQSISTNVLIGNVLNNVILTVYGNSVINGNSIINGASVINGTTTINGNTVLNGNTSISSLTTNYFTNVITSTFTGNVNVGQAYQPSNVSVYGNTLFVGQIISSNYDINLFPNNFGNVWLDVANSLPISNSYYQDVAMSYEGKYKYALMNNKYNMPTVRTSSDYGNNWTNVQLPASISNLNVYQAVPFLSSNTNSFTYNGLIQNGVNKPLQIQSGTYIASGSSTQSLNGGDFWNAFDNSLTTAWSSANFLYNKDTGSYIGSTSTSTDIGPISGEYVQIKLPYSYVIKNYTIYQRIGTTSGTACFPQKLYLCGSIDGSTWISLSGLSGNNLSSPDISYSFGITNTIPYSYYTIIVYSIKGDNTLTADLPCQITKIDFSGFVQNPTGLYSASISTSGTGKYVSVANKAYNANAGNIFISNNYGSSYSDTNLIASGNGTWQQISVSQTGQYQYAIVSNTGQGEQGNIFLSNNYGSFWNDTNFGVFNGWQSISVSSSGQYVTAVQSGNVSNKLGNIWVSNNYGSSWTSSQKIYSYVPYVGAFLSQGSSDFNKTVCVSTSGKYQTVLGLATSDDVTGNANIWINNNYGVGSWINTGYKAYGTASILSSITMDGNGQYQLASFLGNTISSVLKSTNYGATWSTISYSVPSVTVGGNIYSSGLLPKIVTTVNGQYIMGIQKYQDISSNSYNNNNSSATAIGKIVSSSIYVTDNLLSTNYMGSSYTNSIFQIHGFKMNVPNDSNSTLMMGYDTTWDVNYINAADEVGSKPICFNVLGGAPISIGIIQPNNAYALDISGTVQITNDKGFLLVNSPISQNVCIGNGFANLTSGSKNVAVGYGSLQNNTSGSQNVAIGYGSFSNGSVSNSTAIGYNANPTKNNQVVLGTGNETVYIPNKIGVANDNPLYTLDISGIGNITNSKGILYINSNTNNNLCIGNSASLSNLTSGSLNSVFGASSLQNNTSGSQNVAIGYGSLQNNTSGINNTALGYGSFSNGSVSNSTAIGYNANPTKNNQVVLGTGNENVYIPQRLGIRTDAPDSSFSLDISGTCGASLYVVTSDYRLKKNVKELDLSDKNIDGLRPVEYDLVSGKHDMGFLAHEVQEKFPFLVVNEKDSKEMQSLNYVGLISLIIKEIQELKKENKELKETMRTWMEKQS